MFPKTVLSIGVFAVVALSTVKAMPLTNDEIQGLKVINEARAEVGQPALAWDKSLQDAALTWAGNLAIYENFEHAPASERNGSGELISFFQSENRDDIQMANPIRESAKIWLNNDAKEYSVNGFQEANNLSEQLLSAKATHIGCAIHGGFHSITDTQWRLYTVCRVYADIKLIEDPVISGRQDASPGPFKGDITFFNPGLGSCGQTHSDSSMIVALSHLKMGSASNGNPLCGRQILIEADGKSVEATVVDKCMGCAVNDVDVSPTVFTQLLGDLGRGRVSGVTWRFI